MKVGENGYFGILVTPRGQLPNFATRGTSLFTKGYGEGFGEFKRLHHGQNA